MRKHCFSTGQQPSATYWTTRPSLSQSLLLALGGPRRQEGPQRREFTLTMEGSCVQWLVPELQQKSLGHCSTKALTAGDLGAELPRSEEVREKLHRLPSTVLPNPTVQEMDADPVPGLASSTLSPPPPPERHTGPICCLFTERP